jgi:hypothetical protein
VRHAAWAVMVRRYNSNDFTAIHEPCGVFATVMNASGANCTLGRLDVRQFMIDVAPVVRAAAVLAGSASNSSIRVGVGAMWTDFADGYFSDWTSNLLSVVDFFGEDVYPDTSGGSPAYATRLQGFVPYTQAALAMGKAVVANESSSFRWTLIAAVKERSAPIGGCASNEWYQDATKLLWADTVPAAWLRLMGFLSGARSPRRI